MTGGTWQPGLVALDIDGTLLKWVEGAGATYEQIAPPVYEAVQRAIDAGCLFSVNERMLKTKRGRAYARAIPEGRLLIETDFPSKPTPMTIPQDVFPRLARTMSLLTAARGDDERSLASAIAAVSKRLLLP